MQKKITYNAAKFQGGCNTYLEPALLEPGQYSMVQNFRQTHPGLKKRPGQIKLHSTEDTGNVMSLFQFSKGKKTERHFYAQMSDGDVLEATTDPPGVTTGAFGSEVFSGSADSIPGSWAVFNDFMLYANGVDMAQIYPGEGEYVDAFFVYLGSLSSTVIANISNGTDYTLEVTDGDATTYADISSIGSFSAFEGAELITNGTFTTDSGWTKGGDWTIPELLTLDVAPATAWEVGDTITGQTSAKTCTIVKQLTELTYWVTARNGAYTLGEIIGVTGTPEKLADQGAANPTFAVVGVASYGGGEDVSGATVITNGTFGSDTGWTKETGWTIADGVAAYGGDTDTLGDELVTNGDFDPDASWTKGTGWTIAGGVASCDGTTGSTLTQTVTGLTIGQEYQVSIDVVALEHADGYMLAVGPPGAVFVFQQLTEVATYTKNHTATSTSLQIALYNWHETAKTGSFDNVSLKSYSEGGGEKTIKQTVTGLTVGACYAYSIDVVHNAEEGKYVSLYIGGRLQGTYTASDTYTGTYYPAATSEEVKVVCNCEETGSTVDNIILNTFVEGGGVHAIQQTITALVVGQQYAYSIDIVHNGETGFPVTLYIGTRLLVSATASGTYTGYFTAAVADTVVYVYCGAPSIGCTIDNLSLNTYDEFSSDDPGCIFIKTPVPAKSLSFTVSSANGTASVAAVKYWTGKEFTGVSNLVDTTIASAKSFAVDGTMSWDAPTDEQASYFYSSVGYWYMIYLSSGATDAETRISSVTYEADWGAIKNLWDGVWVDAIEAQVYTASTGKYTTYGSEAITLDAMTSSDALYFSSYDDIESIAVEVLTPNAVGDTLALYRWDGDSWNSVNIIDTTAGFTRPGRILFVRGTSKAQNFNYTGYQAHWYKLTTGSTLAATVLVGLQVQPYFNITEHGDCIALSAWKNRMVYAFAKDPQYIYITAEGQPQVLNGDTYDIKAAGDGRSNKIVCMRPFYNELMVFQEEKGVGGGAITLFDGYDIDTFGKLVLSSQYGTMNSQSVEIVEGFNFGGGKDAGLVAFFLSRHGVFYTEGKNVSHVPNFDHIRNYFDPTDTTDCIRTGYESKMWLNYDSAFNVLRIGLVTGSSATACNTFLVYDLTSLSWSVDSYAQELGAFTECEAASGDVPVLQIGGGTDDGFVYLCNSGLNDVSTAIDSYVTPEYDNGGDILHFDEIMLRAKVQSAGTITVTPSLNSIAQTAVTLYQTAEYANHTVRRNKTNLDLTGQHISLKIQHNTVDESCHLLDMNLRIRELTER